MVKEFLNAKKSQGKDRESLRFGPKIFWLQQVFCSENVDISRARFARSILLKKYRSNFGEVDVAPAKNDKVNKVEK